MSIDPDRLVTAYVRNLYADPADPSCRGRYFRVSIHPNRDELNAAADRYDAQHHSPDGPGPAEGIFHSSPMRSRYNRNLKRWVDTSTAYVGMMRLARGYLTGEIIAHESAHAALHIWRLQEWSKTADSTAVDLGDLCGPVEERFCYLLGGITASVNDIVLRYQEAVA